jgi:hypothetical protein
MTIPQYDVNPLMMPMNFQDGGMASSVQKVQSQGRLNDSMLVHMNPQEVAGLQSLARQNGTSLTINPQTGLPEAFNLKSLLPMAAGAALTPVLGPMAPLVVGGLGAMATGSLEQGLMMGLGAYGGASLATNLAGTAANLAAPAAAAPTISAEVAAAELAAANAAAQQAAIQQATAMNLPGGAPTDVFGNVLGIDEMAVAGGQGVSAGLPATVSRPPVSGLSKFFEPDENVTYENIGKGFKNVFSSGESAMDFLGENKMNLAMSAAPMLIPETPEEVERKRAMIRPYDYEVENLTGTDVDPFGTEAERLRGRFVARDPYYAAQGGLMAFAEGGTTSGESSTAAASTTTATPAPTLTPAQADVFRNIFAVQQLAGMPMGMPVATPAAPSSGLTALPNMFAPAAPRPPVAYTPSMVGTLNALDTSEKRYGAAPAASTVIQPPTTDLGSIFPLETAAISPRQARHNEMMATGGPRIGSGTPTVPRRIVGYTADDQPIYLAPDAIGGSAATSSNKFSYDPATGTYKQLAQGGLTSLKAGGLREGAFIVPADVISHLGNGSSEAGMRIVQERLKGRPIKGPGDGMSDSIPTTIAGKQPARVANEEAEIPPEVVAALGGGSLEKGAKKLYEMMDKIRQDRTGKKKQAPAVKADKYMPA